MPHRPSIDAERLGKPGLPPVLAEAPDRDAAHFLDGQRVASKQQPPSRDAAMDKRLLPISRQIRNPVDFAKLVIVSLVSLSEPKLVITELLNVLAAGR